MKSGKFQFTFAFLLGLSLAFSIVQITRAYDANKRWGKTTVGYAFDSTYPINWRDRAREGAAAWTNVTTSSFTWVENNTTPDGRLFLGTIDGAGGTIGQTVTTPRCTNDIVCTFSIKHDQAESWYLGTATPTSTQLDLLSHVTHEFGHAAWSGHSNVDCATSALATMCPSLTPGTTIKRSLEADDRSGIASVYP